MDSAMSFSKTTLRPDTTAAEWTTALTFNDTFTSELPGDPLVPQAPYTQHPDGSSGCIATPEAHFRGSRTVRNALWSHAIPADQPSPRLISVSEPSAALLGLAKQRFWANAQAAAEVWSGARRLPGSHPWAHAYGGHQFGIWADQLGDGRAISLGQAKPAGTGAVSCWELQLKGAGRTPYSRFGDGFAVRRSSIREFLAAEHMHALGVPTSRSLALVFTERPVQREELELGAVVTRMAPSWIRFGSFELPASRKDHALAVGFCHGVMNTDNMSLLGLTIDYGPFAFLDAYDPDFICNHSDTQGRYAFREQPRVALWNLMRLAGSLSTLIDGASEPPAEPSPETVNVITDILNSYAGCFKDEYARMAARSRSFTCVDSTKWRADLRRYYVDVYLPRLRQEGKGDAVGARMRGENPRFVLRNWVAQDIIERVEAGDEQVVDRCLDLMTKHAFDDELPQNLADLDVYAGPVPEWGEGLQCSCSS
ncbi:hypothetical protein BX661DRAFT_217974 [Kickxella alabastrina]|uniref:uncharacterized protein n=1 Tax=Kickxella alabastrina TaxID=61397 RepID=UPI002220803E|nr:uncharacterized protein BX661DRAFT_217974 [Kickxella alabastrina]KAI7820740.1 hypothetical protein BX661DRAFT_217974 [Kickxella alabastrina]